MFLAIYPENIDFGTGLLISIIAIIMVFVVLYIIIGAVKLLEVSVKKTGNKVLEVKKEVKAPVKSATKMTEIKDDDMMVAALIATIDYANETKKDVRLVSIKQIG